MLTVILQLNVSNTDLRLVGAATAIAAWLVLLFTGWAFGGLVHLLVVAALFLVPWRAAPRSTAGVVDDPQDAVDERGDSETN